MATPAGKLHSVVVQLDEEDLEWLDERAERLGSDRMGALVQLLRRERELETRQARAREEVLAYLGDAAKLEPGEAEAIMRRIEGDD